MNIISGIKSLVGKATGSQTFPYVIGDLVSDYEGQSPHWTMHRATSKRDDKPPAVTVFTHDPSKTSPDHTSLAKNALKRIRTLRHPSVLTYVDSLEATASAGGLVQLVTEEVVPLSTALSGLREFPLAVSWGLHQIATAVQFLSMDCKVVHANLCLGSVFVAKNGDWKLWGLDYVTEVDALPGAAQSSPCGPKPPEMGMKDWVAKCKEVPHAMDAYGFGKFVEAVFGCLGQTMPGQVAAIVRRLETPEASFRPQVKHMLESPYFQNAYVETLSFFDNITLKDAAEKEAFFGRKLSSVVDQFPSDVALNKVLPHLVNTIEFGFGAGVGVSKVLSPLLKIAKNLRSEDYAQKIVPQIVKWFGTADKNLRVSLLENAEHYVDLLPRNVIADQLFALLASGFVDQLPAVRDLTVRSMIHFVPKLPDRVVNTEVLKNFARLQLDPEPTIRANTTVCIGKLAQHISPEMRPKVLVPAFSRALKDGFVPARTAGLVALFLTQEFYSAQEAATQVLPVVSPMLMDVEKSVRDEAMRCARALLDKVDRFNRGETPPPAPSSPVSHASSVSVKEQLQHVDGVASAAQLGWSILQTLGKKIGENVAGSAAGDHEAAPSAKSSSQQAAQPAGARERPAQSPTTPIQPSPAVPPLHLRPQQPQQPVQPKPAAAPVVLQPQKAAAAMPVLTAAAPASPAATSAADEGWGNFDAAWGETVFAKPAAPQASPVSLQPAPKPLQTTLAQPVAFQPPPPAAATMKLAPIVAPTPAAAPLKLASQMPPMHSATLTPAPFAAPPAPAPSAPSATVINDSWFWDDNLGGAPSAPSTTTPTTPATQQLLW